MTFKRKKYANPQEYHKGPWSPYHTMYLFQPFHHLLPYRPASVLIKCLIPANAAL